MLFGREPSSAASAGTSSRRSRGRHARSTASETKRSAAKVIAIPSVKAPAALCESQRSRARSLDTRSRTLVEDLAPERALDRLELEAQRILNGRTLPRTCHEVRNESMLPRSLRIDPESVRSLRRERVRSHTLPLLPLAAYKL